MRKNPNREISAFTFVELVVALAVGAIVVLVAVLAYGTIFRNSLPSIQDEDVVFQDNTLQVFYGLDTNTLSVSRAPNFTAAAMAEDMRNHFHDDIASAVAVFCLGRDGTNTLHPVSIPISLTNDVRAWTGRANFNALLANSNAFTNSLSSASNAIKGANLSVYILEPSTDTTHLTVRAVYDTDLVTNTTPRGVYASVKRYEGSTLTGYYHVFYTSDNWTVTNTIWPLACYYPRNSANCTNARPFYLVWWPDPASARMPPLPNANPGTNLRAGYTNMGGQSSFSFVVPAFPAL